jgi:guanosine-3',5'-bis(diphosphate) 3'-pyrophosphohydrolase
LDLLERIRDFAEKAHNGQKRKYSQEEFIKHPERVMKICREYTDDIAVLAAALLHDVLEDTPVTKNHLKDFLDGIMPAKQAGRTYKLVVDLTDVYTNDNYPRLNRRRRKGKEAERLSQVHPDAQTIKYADTMDNALDIVENDKDFARVFIKESQNLLSKMVKGNHDLFKRAEKAVNECSEKLEQD